MQIMTAAQIEPTKITQSLPEGDVSIVACIDGSQWGNNTCNGVAISIGFYQFAEQLFDNFPGIGRGIRPVQQHPAQTGNHAGHP
ncbi:hypothetical protein SDC9_188084 [bioreactor metagenome]|uniref:Uncharacterized protein n=1 Tax=bioreactor metagenome TaxID=1076179 RepID=A0A645HPP9_9ZZZZ